MEVTFTLQFGKTAAEIMCRQYILPMPLTITPPHNHRQGEVHILLAGSADYTVGTENQTLQAGDFIYIPPRTGHSAQTLQPDTRFITFSLRGGPKQALFSSLSPALLDGINLACAESEIACALKPLMPYFYIILGSILQKNGPTIRESRDYDGIILRYLDAHYNQEITLSSLANYVGISAKQVQRIIQKETGNTFLEELTARRMQAARYLEENTSMSSAEIAHYVGYNSYSGYWKARKQHLQKEQE